MGEWRIAAQSIGFGKAATKSLVLKNRYVLLKEIRESLYKKPELQATLNNSKLEDAVKKLKDADLIKERTAPIEDFNTYYVTADGLTAERQLRLAEPLSASSHS